MIQNNTKRNSNDINIVTRGDRRTFPESARISQNLPEYSGAKLKLKFYRLY
jgi:hypothetical protein